ENEGVKAALQVCQRVDTLPIALMALRLLLSGDESLTLTSLREMLHERGALRATGYDASLQLIWELVRDEKRRQLFLLATLFPATAAIPFWLLKLVAGFREPDRGFNTFGSACHQLENSYWMMVEREASRIRLPQLQREFGLQLLSEDARMAARLKAEAGERLVHEWGDINRVQTKIAASNYWQRLEQVRQA